MIKRKNTGHLLVSYNRDHNHFSSLNQSDHCFLALSLPLLSSLITLPIKNVVKTTNSTKNATDLEV